jgi:uncharacterized protein YdeI (YjbR/CyaY-like superfamily)
MPTTTLKTVDLRTRQEWRDWLEVHHQSESEVWLIFHKQHTQIPAVAYDDAVEEALCFGWVDSLIRRLDDDRFARKFTPRKPDSAWSTINRRRYDEMKARGLLAPAGLDRPPTDRSGDAPRPSVTELPDYVEQALKSDEHARDIWQRLAPSHKRAYLAWIDSAKRDETKQRRLEQALRMISEGKKPGL